MKKSQTRTRSTIPTSSLLAAGYSYLKISLALLLLFLIPTTFIDAENIWNIERQELLSRIRSSDYEFLTTVDFARFSPQEATRIGPGGAYYMAYLYRDLGMIDRYRALLEAEATSGTGIWRREAGSELVMEYLSTEEYQDAEEIARRLVSEDSRDPWHLFLLIESIYWQYRDREVLELMDRIQLLDLSLLSEGRRRELVLFRSASMGRLEISGWKEQFVELFSSQPASTLHKRANVFLRIDDRITQFSREQQNLIRGVVELAERRYRGAIEFLESLLLSAPTRYGDWLIRNCATAYRLSGLVSRGSATMEKVRVVLLPTLVEGGESSRLRLFAATESAARLHRQAGRLKIALDLYRDAESLATEPGERERMLWYQFSTLAWLSPKSAIDELPAMASRWRTPSYFADAIGGMIDRLLRSRDWQLLARLYFTSKDLVDPSTLSRLAYITARLLREGHLEASELLMVQEEAEKRSEPPSSIEFSDLILKDAMAPGADPYYTHLAAAILGTEPTFLATEKQRRGETAGVYEDLVLGFLDYGLIDWAHARASAHLNELSDTALLRLAADLAREGNYIESIRMTDRLSGTLSGDLKLQAMEHSYPRPFIREIEDAAQRENLPIHLFFALIRQESYFSHTVHSHAGAVGLTQLMPSTAEDIASRMKFRAPDLLDPKDNLAIGAWYLRYLWERLEDRILSVLAYNAGPNRVRSWRKEYPPVPVDLFLELLPYEETRSFGREVLFSAITYGYLYYDLEPREVIATFYPFLINSIGRGRQG